MVHITHSLNAMLVVARPPHFLKISNSLDGLAFVSVVWDIKKHIVCLILKTEVVLMFQYFANSRSYLCK